MMSLTVRQERMRLLALASVERLEAGLSAITPPDYEVVRGPETGLVMIRGRVGTPATPNMGEALATRCVVSLKDGCLGYAWILGEDARRAELAALYDALWQRDGYAEPLDRELLPALEAERARRVREDAAAVEPTRVDFFTLVRGED
ncbi:MAG: phosphonate C-P lyase system protein PhnG [Bilophila wadsworthia]